MGTGVSKPTQLESYGSLKLSDKQTHDIAILSNLITLVIQKNNLFDLSELLNSPNGCQSLLVLLESKLKDEFMTLRFPDPQDPSKLSMTYFLPLNEYKYYQKTPGREALCKHFAFFIIRLTTLLSALVASVAFQQNIATQIINNLNSSAGTPAAGPIYHLPFTSISGNPINPAVLELLGQNSNFYRVPNDPRPLYYFKQKDASPSIVIDATLGLVYSIANQSTPVLGITITPKDSLPTTVNPWILNSSSTSPPFGDNIRVKIESAIAQVPYPQRHIPSNTLDRSKTPPVPIQNGQNVVLIMDIGSSYYFELNNFRQFMNAQPLNGPLNNPATGLPISNNAIIQVITANLPLLTGGRGGGGRQSRRTSHRRKGRGKLSRRFSRPSRQVYQHGSAGPLFEVRLFNILKCDSPTQLCELTGDMFTLDEQGNTLVERQPGFGNFQEKVFFNDRMERIFRNHQPVTMKIDQTKEPVEKLQDFKFLNEINEETYTQFQTIQNIILGKDANNHMLTSPAFYRALLLISSIRSNGKNEELFTMFCDDKWTGRLTGIVPYALLQALYYNLPPTPESSLNITMESKNELETTVSLFRKYPIARNNIKVEEAQLVALDPKFRQQLKDEPETFSKLQFIPPREITKEFCKASAGGQRPTYVPDQILILKKGYNAIHELYNKHLINVIQLISKILSLGKKGVDSPRKFYLKPIFITNPKGAQDALENFIGEGRKLISQHYLDVETAYKASIDSIKKLSEGAAPP